MRELAIRFNQSFIYLCSKKSFYESWHVDANKDERALASSRPSKYFQWLSSKYYYVIGMLKMCDFCPHIQTSIPSHNVFPLLERSRKLKHLTTKSKSKEYNGSPCRSPHSNIKGGVGEPFNKIDAESDVMQEVIQRLHCFVKQVESLSNPRRTTKHYQKSCWSPTWGLLLLRCFFFCMIQLLPP